MSTGIHIHTHIGMSTRARVRTHTLEGPHAPFMHTENIREREHLQYPPDTYTLVQRTWVDKRRNHLILHKVQLILKQW